MMMSLTRVWDQTNQTWVASGLVDLQVLLVLLVPIELLLVILLLLGGLTTHHCLMVMCGLTALMLNCLSGMTMVNPDSSRSKQWVQAVGGAGHLQVNHGLAPTTLFNLLFQMAMRFLLISIFYKNSIP